MPGRLYIYISVILKSEVLNIHIKSHEFIQHKGEQGHKKRSIIKSELMQTQSFFGIAVQTLMGQPCPPSGRTMKFSEIFPTALYAFHI